MSHQTLAHPAGVPSPTVDSGRQAATTFQTWLGSVVRVPPWGPSPTPPPNLQSRILKDATAHQPRAASGAHLRCLATGSTLPQPPPPRAAGPRRTSPGGLGCCPETPACCPAPDYQVHQRASGPAPLAPLSRVRGGVTGLALPGSRSSPRPGRVERVRPRDLTLRSLCGQQ